MRQALLVVLMAVAALGLGTTRPQLPTEFSANVTYSTGGFNYTGYMVWDATGHRSFKRVHELNESTFQFQDYSSPMLYKYAILSSGCTCESTRGGTVGSFFAAFAAAVKKGSCAGGDLYVNDALVGLPGVPNGAYCVSGNTPIYYEDGSTATRYTFHNFKAGHPDDFPVDVMNNWVNTCGSACI